MLHGKLLILSLMGWQPQNQISMLPEQGGNWPLLFDLADQSVELQDQLPVDQISL
jgi:hypothetical protein